jgi:acyl transferase domain-containing protein
MSGTNAHVILEQAPPVVIDVAATSGVDTTPVPLIISAHGDAALAAQAGRLASFLAERPDLSLSTVRAALAARPALPNRAVIFGDDRADILADVAALAEGQPTANLVRGVARERGAPVFVFAGHGAQWPGMAAELLARAPVFAESMRECTAALAAHLDWPIETELAKVLGDEEATQRPDVLQPVLWAVMVSLARMWRSYGVNPAGVIGHSQGEVAAACVAEALSLSEGARVVAVRAKLLAGLPATGAMAAVALPVDEVEAELAEFGGRLSVAAVNGPEATVVSGAAEACHDLVARYQARGARARLLKASRAGHSAHVEPMRDTVLAELAGLAPKPPAVPFYSTVTGGRLGTDVDAGYWYRNLREPVRFDRAVLTALDGGHRAFVEVSAHPVLTAGIEDLAHVAEMDAVVISTLRRSEGGPERMATAAAEAYVSGIGVDWSSSLPDTIEPVDLPTYAFQSRRFWVENTASGQVRERQPLALAPTPTERTGVGFLAGLAPADQYRQLLDLVRAEVATLLGHDSPAAVDPNRAFLELGMDSVAAVALRNRLDSATGRWLTVRQLADLRTPDALARHLRTELFTSNPADDGGPGELRLAVAAAADDPAQAARFGAKVDAVTVRLPRFDTADAQDIPVPYDLATGPAEPMLMCFPTVLATSGAHQFVRLAAQMAGQRPVCAFDLPGFTGAGRLPASWAALVDAAATAVSARAGSRAVALAGYSSGGLLAHAVAAKLAALGTPATALVLVDTYPPGPLTLDRLPPALLSGVARGLELLESDDRRVAAMGGYLALIGQWQPGDPIAPTLLVRATSAVPGYPPWRVPPWQVPWPGGHAVRDVPGDHFTLIQEHAADTAAVLSDWLADLTSARNQDRSA